ncbi:MAG: glycosyltransferase [Candidatus Scalindua sp.]|nr:glycosyltransferase [Candidatus Scalindua sp.]
MKIAFIVDAFPCLSETFILNQITGLIDRGHDVDIFANGPRNDTMIHADIERYNLLNRTFYFSHGTSYQTMPKNICVRIIKAIILVITNFHKKPIPLLKSLNILTYGKESASLCLLYKTVTFLNKNTYDIVHCHFGHNGNLGVILKYIGAIKGKVITTFHGADISWSLKRQGSNMYDYLFKQGDLFLPISERWKKELIRLGCNERKIIVHRMGIDTSKFEYLDRKLNDDGKIQLLTIARLVEKKGVQYGIQAVAKVLKEYQNIEYTIVGDGHLKNDLENLIDELNINNKIKLVGRKRQEEIIELMKQTDIFLAPSVTAEDGDQEGIPVVLMEALSQGIPVISTRHSGIPELVEDGKSGFLVPERDVEGLSEKLEYLIKHQETWPQMGREGSACVEKYFDINKLNNQLVELYQQLLSGDL